MSKTKTTKRKVEEVMDSINPLFDSLKKEIDKYPDVFGVKCSNGQYFLTIQLDNLVKCVKTKP